MKKNYRLLLERMQIKTLLNFISITEACYRWILIGQMYERSTNENVYIACYCELKVIREVEKADKK